MNTIIRLIIIALVLIAVAIFIYAIIDFLTTADKKIKNQKRGNLHLTVDKGWEKRFKNNK